MKDRRYAMKIPGMLRLLVVALVVVVQVLFMLWVVMKLRVDTTWFWIGFQVLGLITALFVVRKDRNPTYAVSWIILILGFPVLGLIMYFLWGRNAKFAASAKRLRQLQRRMEPFLDMNEPLLETLREEQHERSLQAQFLMNAGFPVYTNTSLQYFPSGEKHFKKIFEDIENAREFVFLEFFILADGDLWSSMEKLLIKKASQGVDVRLMFDDFGSVIKAPNDLIRRLRENNVQVIKFNPVMRYISRLYINYRNHQKIIVIDGEIGHTGGSNIADEYVNIYPRFGHWKDTGIRLQGDAAWGLTSTFLMMWEFESGTAEPNYAYYMPRRLQRERGLPVRPEPAALSPADKALAAANPVISPGLARVFEKSPTAELYDTILNRPDLTPPRLNARAPFSLPGEAFREGESFVIPYWDGPTNNPNNPSEDIYLSLINTAVDYCYFSTPYFIVDDAMVRAICRAAESGVDVRMITPGIPDKPLVFQVTRSHYKRLLESGVKIYEYEPGFIHAKTMIVDGTHCITGSVNFDYRSFNLHYENAIWICNDPVYTDIYLDFVETFGLCRELDIESWRKRPLGERILQPVLKLFAPLM